MQQGTPCILRVARSGPSFVTSELASGGRARSTGIDLVDFGNFVVEHEHAQLTFGAQHVERLESRAAPGDASRHRRHPRALELIEHETRDHELAADHTRARDNGNNWPSMITDVSTTMPFAARRTPARARVVDREAEHLEHGLALMRHDAVPGPRQDPRPQTHNQAGQSHVQEQRKGHDEHAGRRAAGQGTERSGEKPGRRAPVDTFFDTVDRVSRTRPRIRRGRNRRGNRACRTGPGRRSRCGARPRNR